MASVSVVIPCYNYGHFLGDAVRSVLDDQAGVDVPRADHRRRLARRQRRGGREPSPPATHASRPSSTPTTGAHRDVQRGPARLGRRRLQRAHVRRRPRSRRARCAAVDLLDANPEVGFAYGYALRFRGRRAAADAADEGHGDGRSGPDARGSSGGSGRPARASPRPRSSSAPRCSSGSAATTRGCPRRRHRDVDAARRPSPTSGTCAGSTRRSTGGTPQNMSRRRPGRRSCGSDGSAFDSILERYGPDLADAPRWRAMVHRKLAWEALWRGGPRLRPRVGPETRSTTWSPSPSSAGRMRTGCRATAPSGCAPRRRPTMATLTCWSPPARGAALRREGTLTARGRRSRRSSDPASSPCGSHEGWYGGSAVIRPQRRSRPGHWRRWAPSTHTRSRGRSRAVAAPEGKEGRHDGQRSAWRSSGRGTGGRTWFGTRMATPSLRLRWLCDLDEERARTRARAATATVADDGLLRRGPRRPRRCRPWPSPRRPPPTSRWPWRPWTPASTSWSRSRWRRRSPTGRSWCRPPRTAAWCSCATTPTATRSAVPGAAAARAQRRARRHPVRRLGADQPRPGAARHRRALGPRPARPVDPRLRPAPRA